MTPPKPPRKSCTLKPTVTNSCEVAQSVYEDPDALVPDVTDGGQSEVKVKPVPRPRARIQPKATDNNNAVDSGDKASTSPNAEPNECPADYKRPPPVRPPLRPPLSKHVAASKPTGVNSGSYYGALNPETNVEPPAASTESRQSSPPQRPKRPPPSSYYDRLSSTTRPTSEICTNESQQSKCSSISLMQQTPALSDEVESLCGNHSSMPTNCTDRPVVPPRLWQCALPSSTAVCETSPPQTSLTLPPFSPPPPPSLGTPSESLYSEIECRPYLEILPEDDEDFTTRGGSTLSFGHHTESFSSRQQTTAETEDINKMLKWLKRVSKSDVMAPPLYGLSIQEEISFFNQRAMNVKKALRLYNLLMLKRNKSLQDIILEFRSISQSLDKIEKQNKTVGIAGGTTGAVGGVTAVLGIALAPVTMGTSLIATVLGAGMVASAGGVGAHTAKQAKKKTVSRMKVDKIVYEYKTSIIDVEHCLDFILCGMNELRRHDIARLQRAGAQIDALKMAHQSQFVIRNCTNNNRRASAAHTDGMSSERLLQAFDKEMDQYFTEKDDQKLKKSNNSRFSARVRLLAENLQDELDHLNRMWEMFS